MMIMSTRLRSLGLLTTAVLTLTACGGGGALQRDESNRVVKGGTASVFELEIGDCLFNELGKIADEVLEIDLVPCDQEHTHEVFFKAEHPEGPYPGSAAIEEFAQRQCVGAYYDYVGVELSESVYYYTFLFPSVSTWNDDKDREVVCFVVSREQLLTASVQGTKL
jgi:hypothetical protein